MTVIFWIIDKLGSLFSLVGIVCLIWLSEAVKAGEISETSLTVCLFVGILTAIGGILYGITTYNNDVSPRMLWFMSAYDLLDSTVGSAILWGFRFYWLPTIIYLIFHLATL